MSVAERAEAMDLADELLLRRTLDRRIVSALQQRYDLDGRSAKSLLARARKLFMAAFADGLKQRRVQYLRSLDRLYERAWADGKLNVCVQVLGRIADAEGFAAPLVVQHDDVHQPRSAWELEAEGRPPEDLRYYLAHGHWPEQAPRTAAASGAESGSGGTVVAFPLPAPGGAS